MLSVSSETAIRVSQTAASSRFSDDGSAPSANDFSGLIANDPPARDSNPDTASDKPTGDRPAAAQGSTASKPSTNKASDDPASAASNPVTGTPNNPADTPPAAGLGSADSANAETATGAAAAAIAAATTAAAKTSAIPADGTTPPDKAADPSQADATDPAAGTTLPALIIAAIVPAPVSAQPAAAADGQSVGAVAAPGAIAAAAAEKVASDIASTTAQPTAAIAAGSASADAAPDATSQGPATPAATSPAAQGGDPAAQTQTGVTAAATIDPSLPATADAAVPAAVVAEASAALAQAKQPQIIVAGKGRPSDAPAAPKTGIVDTIKAAPAAIELTPQEGLDVSKAGPNPADAATTAPAGTGAARQLPEKPRDPAAKTDETPSEAAPVLQAHHQPLASEPKLTVAAAQLDLAAATTTISAGTPSLANSAAPVTEGGNQPVVVGTLVPLNALAVEISANARAGNTRFEIRLDPPELGRIDVRLDVNSGGQVTSRLVVERSETLDLLRRDAPQLQQALHDAGLKTTDNGLQFSLRDQTMQRDGQGSGQNPQRLVITEEDTPMVEAASRSYIRSLGSSGGIDIRV